MKRLPYVWLLLMAVGWLSSCRTQYIPVEKVKTEYRVRDSIRHDSIYQHDSLYMFIKGETVFQYKYKYLYKYKYVDRTDTVMKTDSIQIPYPVEKTLSGWQRFKLDFGGAAIGVLIVIIIVKLKNLKTGR